MKKKTVSDLDYFEGRYNKMRRLVEEYGIEGSQLALQQCIWAIEEEQKNKGGHPLEYGVPQLMEIWLYVEEAMARTGRSAESVCRDRKAAYHRTENSAEGLKTNSLKGTTLLRRYRQANAAIKSSSSPYKNVPQGITIKIEGVVIEDISPFEKHWRSELERRLTSKTVR
jgi:hypothetical protein